MPDVLLPNGVTIRGVPDGIGKDQIRMRAIEKGLAQESDFALPTDNAADLSRSLMPSAPNSMPETEQPKALNAVRGAVERGGQLLSGLFRTGAAAASALEEKLPLGGFVFDGGMPKYYGPEKYAQLKQDKNIKEPLNIAADSWAKTDAGYVPEHTWESVKQAFTDGDLRLSDAGEVIAYGLEQGIKSTPDMIAVMMNLPAYVITRAGEIGETRAKNKGKADTDLIDVVEAIPFALGSALLERVGAGRIANPAQVGKEALEAGFLNAAKRIGKDAAESAGTEAATEFVQEGILEYLGEKFGTGADMSLGEAAERGLAGAVAGGVYGAGAGAAASTVNEVVKPKSVAEMVMERVAAEINAEMDAAQAVNVEQEAVRSMSPENATREVVSESVSMDAPATVTTSQVDPSSIPAFEGVAPDTTSNAPVVAVTGESGPQVIDGQGRAEAARMSGTPLSVVTVTPAVYQQMQQAGFSDTEIAYAAMKTAGAQAVTQSPSAKSEAAAATMAELTTDTFASKGVDNSSMDMPMPGWQPMYRQITAPERAREESFQLGQRTVKLKPENKPTRREGIRVMLEDIIGPRLYQSKIKGKSKLGFYRRNNSEVRTKSYDDVETMAHEMAHYLDFHHTFAKVFTRLRNQPQFKKQVEQFSYTSDPRLVKSEGFAEFVRLWLTQYNKVIETAPEFTKAFEETLNRSPAFARKMTELQEEMHKWYLQGPRASFRAKSGKELTPAQSLAQYIQSAPAERYRQNAIDKIHGIKVIERTIRGDIADANRSAYKQFQMVNGAEAMHEAVVRYGTPELTEEGDFKFSGKGLKDIFWPAAKHGYERFDLLMEYFKARRAHELLQQGRENLFTRDEIAAGLELGEQYSEFREVFREYQAFNKRMLDFYVQMGLLSEDQRKAFADANKNYVPFHRVIESIEDGKGEGATIGKRLTGGTMNTREIADNIIEGLYSNIRAATIARARQTLFKDIARSQEGSLFAVKIPPDSKQVKVHLQQQAMAIAQAMANLGMTISSNGMIVANAENLDGQITDVNDIANVLIDNPGLMTFWTQTMPRTLETHVEAVNIDGKTTYFEVRSPLLVEALTGMRGFKSGALLNALFHVKNLQTRTITSMLQFLGPNAVRDTVSAAVISKNKFIPVFDTLRGMAEMIFTSDLYKEFMLNGGGYGTRIEARTVEGRSRSRIDLPASSGWDYAAKAFAGYDRFASTFEYGSRLGDYRKGRKAGKNALEAAWEAREVATDFAKMPGSEAWAKYLRMVPFMNAGIQGLDKTAREIFEIKGKMTGANLVKLHDAKVKFLLTGSMITTMTGILWLINQDDDRYKALTADQKSRFWWIFPPEGGAPIKIPRPYDIGHIFASIPETALDYIKDKDGKAAAENLAWTMVNSMGIGDYPGILQPIVEAQINETFTGAPVIPEYMMNRPAEYQYTDRTPILYRNIGKALGVSPLLAEHYTKGYLRYVEALISDASENVLWNKEQWGERPFARGNPIDYLTYQFAGQKVPYRTKWTEGYYNLKNKAAGMRGAFAAAQSEAIRDGKALASITGNEVNTALIALDGAFNQIDRAFQDQDMVLADIKYDPTLPVEIKEQRIEAWYKAKNDTLAQVYQLAEKTLREIEEKMPK